MSCWDHGIVYEYSDFHGAKPPECKTKWLYRPRFAVRHAIAMVGKNSLCVTVIALFNNKFFMLSSLVTGGQIIFNRDTMGIFIVIVQNMLGITCYVFWVPMVWIRCPPCQNDPTAQSSNVINVNMWSNVSCVDQTLMLVSLSFLIHVTNTTVLFYFRIPAYSTNTCLSFRHLYFSQHTVNIILEHSQIYSTYNYFIT